MRTDDKPLPPIVSGLNSRKLAEDMKDNRGEKGLREIARITNVSASTLSRIEREETPDLLTYVALCRWLDVPLDTYIIHWKVTL